MTVRPSLWEPGIGILNLIQIIPTQILNIPQLKDTEAHWQVLSRIVAACGKEKLLHVWDRGLANGPWLGQVLEEGWHFVVRWKKGNKLRPAEAPSIGNPQATPTQKRKGGYSRLETDDEKTALGTSADR